MLSNLHFSYHQLCFQNNNKKNYFHLHVFLSNVAKEVNWLLIVLLLLSRLVVK